MVSYSPKDGYKEVGRRKGSGNWRKEEIYELPPG
jgi:hypothetical protein